MWRDWVLLCVLVPAAVAEGLLREDLSWPPVAIVLGVVTLSTLLWRRTHPLVVVAVAVTVQTLADVASLFGAGGSALLYTSGAFAWLLLSYSLFRWGAGREAAIGLAIILVSHFFASTVVSTVGEAVVAIPFLLFPPALGASVRYRANSKLREEDQVRLLEREQLARELHDTVAHHVSAIAVQAQAGRTLAASRPDVAVGVLQVIEEEASRALAEMRAMVGALRQGEETDLAPQRGVADIEGLAHSLGNRPRVDVELSGDLDNLGPSVEAAIYRLTQESLTNAVRHARHATLINIYVAADDDCVRLSVRDDGDPSLYGAGSSSGYGLVGMAERAKLLGGTLEAGPRPDRGWTVTAVLPRKGIHT